MTIPAIPLAPTEACRAAIKALLDDPARQPTRADLHRLLDLLEGGE